MSNPYISAINTVSLMLTNLAESRHCIISGHDVLGGARCRLTDSGIQPRQGIYKGKTIESVILNHCINLNEEKQHFSQHATKSVNEIERQSNHASIL